MSSDPHAVTRKVLGIACTLIAANLFAARAAHAQSRDPKNMEFNNFVRDQYDAITRGDTVMLRLRFANDLVWVVGANGASVGKEQIIAAAAHIQTPVPHYEVDSLLVSFIGGIAVVEYLRTDHRDLGEMRSETHNRVMDLYRPRGAGWELVRHAQTWVVSSPPSISLDSAALAAFVGRYEIGPGFVDNVHFESGHLTATSTTEAVGARLVPVSADAFSPEGTATIIVFERDAAGRVTGYVQQNPDGHVRRAPRLPDPT